MKEFNEDTDKGLSNDKSANQEPSHNNNNFLKKDLIEAFRKCGYLEEDKDYEVRIKITSGNIAWINIRGIETIK
jgi:hypothetical protein